MLNGFFGVRQGTNLLPLELISKAYYDKHELPYPFMAGTSEGAGHAALIQDTTPYGDDVVYQVVANYPDFSPSGTIGGIQLIGGVISNPSYIVPDKTKKYRFSVMVKTDQFGKQDAYNDIYLGSNRSGGNQALIHSVTGMAEINPYFIAHKSISLNANEWYLFYGHLYPYGTRLSQAQVESGIVDMQGNLVTGNLLNNAYSFNSNTSELMLRAISHYGTRSGIESRFYHPRIEICDGSEPTIQELLIRKFG